MTIRDEDLEKEIVEKGLTAPRVTLVSIQSKIVHREVHKHITVRGSVLRWCILTMENGFTVTGKPSACVSIENDNCEIGEKIAIDNAMNEAWALEGYLLKEQLYKNTPPPIKINLVPPREQFFIDERKIETLSAPPGTSYIRCIIRLKRDEAIYIVHQLELDTDTDFAYAVKLLIADVDKHASSICEQLHKKLLNGEYVSHE